MTPELSFLAEGFDFENTPVDVTVDVLSGVDEWIRRGISSIRTAWAFMASATEVVVNDLVTRTNRFKCAVSVAGVYPDWLLRASLRTDTTIPAFEGGASF